MQAAKLNVYHGPTFLYIGHYYRDVMKNSAKALRCYEKAYSLGSKDEETGSALADQYISEGMNACTRFFFFLNRKLFLLILTWLNFTANFVNVCRNLCYANILIF